MGQRQASSGNPPPKFDIDSHVKQLEEQGLTRTVQYEIAKVYQYFRYWIEKKRFYGLTAKESKNQHPLVPLLEKIFMERGLDRPAPLAAFTRTNFAKFTLSYEYIVEIVAHLHHLPPISDDPDLAESWRKTRAAISRPTYRFRDLLSRDQQVLDYRKSPVQGDYLLFRADNHKQLVMAFLRFYKHESGGVRSVGLRLDRGNDYIGSKGWLTLQARGVLMVTHTVERPHSTGKARQNGGSSSLWIDTDHGKCVKDGDVVVFGTALHFLAAHEVQASCSRAVLIRFQGYEREGGSGEDMPQEGRWKAIRQLQKTLSTAIKKNPIENTLGYTLIAKGLSPKVDYKNLTASLDRHFSAENVHDAMKQNSSSTQDHKLNRPARANDRNDHWHLPSNVAPNDVYLDISRVKEVVDSSRASRGSKF